MKKLILKENASKERIQGNNLFIYFFFLEVRFLWWLPLSNSSNFAFYSLYKWNEVTKSYNNSCKKLKKILQLCDCNRKSLNNISNSFFRCFTWEKINLSLSYPDWLLRCTQPWDLFKDKTWIGGSFYHASAKYSCISLN